MIRYGRPLRLALKPEAAPSLTPVSLQSVSHNTSLHGRSPMRFRKFVISLLSRVQQRDSRKPRKAPTALHVLWLVLQFFHLTTPTV